MEYLEVGDFLIWLFLPKANKMPYRLSSVTTPSRGTLSWICSTLTEFRLLGFAQAGSICSLSGLTTPLYRPSANSPPLAFAVKSVVLPVASSTLRKQSLLRGFARAIQMF